MNRRLMDAVGRTLEGIETFASQNTAKCAKEKRQNIPDREQQEERAHSESGDTVGAPHRRGSREANGIGEIQQESVVPRP